MDIKQIDDCFSTTGQIRPEQVEALAAEGYRLIVCNRPDGEDAGQPAFAEIAEAASKAGISAVHIPMTGAPTGAQVDALRNAMAGVDGKILGYCRSGARSQKIHAALND
ncbi:TIGR01244 family sulfur transferase [Pelagibacterium luteolum]|uniref:TIGR01244 family protein n=1 Tax=Pelagibacterium luteolum TaxID=440168 RepID=A0A1G7Z691_9HYPH|nr:TIGR01244 family sulfur transferase [Pelagibacterium luteolum]SDH03650.1 TIGR01244 family protein [Pelagibacterium luteolum]